MKAFLTVVIIVAVAWFVVTFRNYAKKEMAKGSDAAEERYAPGKLPGLPAEMEASLESAKRDGPEGLKKWLAQNREQVAEPRLTDIELDYVVLVGPENRAEARRVLDAIKARIKPTSKAHKRFEQLDKAYP